MGEYSGTEEELDVGGAAPRGCEAPDGEPAYRGKRHLLHIVTMGDFAFSAPQCGQMTVSSDAAILDPPRSGGAGSGRAAYHEVTGNVYDGGPAG